MRRKKEDIRWLPNIAYAVGLIATDGCLSPDGRHLELTSKDIQLLETFKGCLNLKNKIGSKTSGFSNKRYHRIQFSNVALYRWLLQIGLTPNKSRTIGKLKIPRKYFFDFLRGVFDGDGSCYGYLDPRWKSSFMFYTSFTSGSLLFLKWLRQNAKNLIKIHGHLKTGDRNWQLCYAKAESRILFEKMYYKRELPFLKRKYEKLKKFIAYKE
jgi:hypothetical protein